MPPHHRPELWQHLPLQSKTWPASPHPVFSDAWRIKSQSATRILKASCVKKKKKKIRSSQALNLSHNPKGFCKMLLWKECVTSPGWKNWDERAVVTFTSQTDPKLHTWVLRLRTHYVKHLRYFIKVHTVQMQLSPANSMINLKRPTAEFISVLI